MQRYCGNFKNSKSFQRFNTILTKWEKVYNINCKYEKCFLILHKNINSLNLQLNFCPRCNISFECKKEDISNCQCNFPIAKETKEFISKTNYNCLCKNCLKHYNQLVLLFNNHTFPTHKDQLIEGLHYYIENQYLVFSEFYHLLRGYCCKNGCRHCVYGNK